MKFRVAVGLLVGSAVLTACGVSEIEDEGTFASVGVTRDAITYAVSPGSGGVQQVGTAVGASGSGWIYGRNTSTQRLHIMSKNNPVNPWGEEGFVTEGFLGKPAAAVTSIACDAVFVQKLNGQIGFVIQALFGEFWCRSGTATFQTIFGSPVVSGSPAVTSSFSGTTHRFDVFVRNSNGNLVSTTGTGALSSLAWAPWTTDTSITTATDPAAVATTGGRIDLVVCDSSGALRHRIFFGGTWGAWTTAATGCGGYSPSIVGGSALPKGTTGLTVVAKDPSSNQYRSITYNSSSGWSGWTPLGGSFFNYPALHFLPSGLKRVWGLQPTGISFGDF